MDYAVAQLRLLKKLGAMQRGTYAAVACDERLDAFLRETLPRSLSLGTAKERNALEDVLGRQSLACEPRTEEPRAATATSA